MEYSLSVQQSSPKAILGVLSYYDTTYGVVLTHGDDDKVSFLVLTSANNSVGNDFRLEMDASGQITEYVMRNGDKQDIKQPNVLVETEVEKFSQKEFLLHVANVLSVL